jgi:hypothetical protein
MRCKLKKFTDFKRNRRMDLEQAKVLLKKINTLNDSLSLDQGQIASIERDLMLSYVRQLYEAYLSKSPNGLATTQKAGIPTEMEVSTPAPKQQVAPEPPKRKYTPPKIIEIPDTTPEPVKVTTPPPPRKVTPPPAPKSAPATANKGNNDPKIKALFDTKEAKELSEKLSLQPLKDLTKGLSINDRLLYTNDLFNKDTTLFNEALKALNKLDSMDLARPFLEDQAAKYDWTNGEKADVAQAFIKHVRRKYV